MKKNEWFPDLMKNINLQIQWTLSLKKKKEIHTQIHIVKLVKTYLILKRTI